MNCSLNRKRTTRTIGNSTAHAMATLALLLIACPAKAQTVLPSDAAADCTVSPAEFKSWFKDNVVKKDGEVKPANSLGFAASSECAFYRWSEQMFLWLTSPLPSGRHTFNSNEFFAIGAPDPAADGMRKLIRQNTPEQKGFGPSLALAPQPSVVTDSTGRRRPVVILEATASAASPFVDKSNRPVDVASVAATADGKPILLDRSNKAIDFREAANGAPAITGPSARTVQLADTTVQVGNSQRLVTVEGAVVETGQTESGQATLDVLISKNNAIVFYLLQVNDVYAYFKIGIEKKGILPQQQFPSDLAVLNLTEAFAKSVPPPNTMMNGFGDRIALAMELKSSWVDVDTLPAAVRKDYLIIKADFPVYETGDTLRKPISMKSGQLALVGFHVVGTALGHPEMIWATFEHVNNAPNLKYSYKTAAGPTVIRDMDGPGDWLFSTAGAAEAQLVTRAKMSGQNIVAFGPAGTTIGTVNVTRKFPWGSVDSDAPTNTKIIAINNSVLGQLAPDDVRRKYLLVGAIWTDGTKPDRTNESNQLGTKALANATMETFIQQRDCFFCHQGDLLAPGLSRIWDTITPEFPQ